MKHVAIASALGLALLGLALAPPAAAQPPAIAKNPQIDVAYVAPKNPRFQSIHARMTKLRVLETLQQFLSPLKLNRKITVKLDECGGAITVPYQPQGPVTICYEHIMLIRANLPAEGVVNFGRDESGRPMRLTLTQALVGAVVQLLLEQTAYAVFDVLQIPVWGTVDDAATNVAGFIMLEFGDEVAWTTLMGSAWFLAQRGLWGTGFFSDTVRQSEAQRFYNYLCIAYGARPSRYRFLVNSANLPENRAKYCPRVYLQLRSSFRQTIMPHVDRDLLAQARATRWLPR
jgi:hypothetical protein